MSFLPFVTLIVASMCVGWAAFLVPLSMASPSCTSASSCRPPVSGGGVVGYWPFDDADATLDLNISRSVTSVRFPSTTASVCSAHPNNTRTLSCSSFSTSLQPIFSSGAAVTSTSMSRNGKTAASFAEIQGDAFNSDRLSLSIWMATTNTSDTSIRAIKVTLFAGQCALLTSSGGGLSVVPHRSSCLQWWVLEGRVTLALPALNAASSQTWVVLSSTAPLAWENDEWHHLSVVCSALQTADDGACRFYHNGQALSTSRQQAPWTLVFTGTVNNISSTFPLPAIIVNSSSPLSTDCRGLLALLDQTTALQAVTNGSYSATQHGDGVNMTLVWNDRSTLNVSSSCSVPQQYVVAAAWSDEGSSTSAVVWLDELWVVNFALTQQQRQSMIQHGTPVSPRISSYYSFDHGVLSRRGGGHSTFALVNGTVEIAALSIPAVVRQGLGLPPSVHVQTNTTNMFRHPRWDLSYSWSVASYVGFNASINEAIPLWSFVTPGSTMSHHHVSFWPEYSAGAGSTPSVYVSYGTLNQTVPVVGSALTLTNASTDATQWYHVAVTFDVESEMLSVYINGNIGWSANTAGVLSVQEAHQNVTVALGNNPHSPHFQGGDSAGSGRRLLQTPGQGSVYVDQFQWGNTVLSVEEIEYMSSPNNVICTATPQVSGCPILHLSLDASFTESFYNDAVYADSSSVLNPNGVFGGMASLQGGSAFITSYYSGITVTPNAMSQWGVFKSFQNDASVAFWVYTVATSRPAPYWTMYQETDPDGNSVAKITWYFDRIYVSTTSTSYITYNDTRLWSENQWHHVLLVYRWNQNTLSLYVDNIPVVIMTIVSSTRYSSTTVMLQQWGGQNMYVDELYAFNVAIEQDMEVALVEINTIFITAATCPTGTYYLEAYNTVEQQQTRYCYTCAIGLIFNASSGACEPCSAGYFGKDTSTCSPCPAGSSSNVTGASSSANCILCGPGSFSSQPASTACSACRAGYSSNLTSATNCSTACAPGTQSQAGAATCTNCMAGYTSFGGPAGCQPCQANYVQSNNACAYCGANNWSYSGQAGDTNCYSCAGGCNATSPYTSCGAACS